MLPCSLVLIVLVTSRLKLSSGINYYDHITTDQPDDGMHRLYPGDKLYSQDGNTRLTMSTNGRWYLEQIDINNTSSVWIEKWSTTSYVPPKYITSTRPAFTIQSDRNIVVYQPRGNEPCDSSCKGWVSGSWSSQPKEKQNIPYHFFVHNNGYAYLLDKDWKYAQFTTDPSIQPTSDPTLYPSGTLTQHPTSSPSTPVSENESLKEEISRLKKQQKEYELSIQQLNDDIANLKLKCMNTANYQQWKPQEIVHWMISIDINRFNKYKEPLLYHLNEEEIVGSDLNDINEVDLQRWQIKNFKDKKVLLQKIKELTQHQLASGQDSNPFVDDFGDEDNPNNPFNNPFGTGQNNNNNVNPFFGASSHQHKNDEIAITNEDGAESGGDRYSVNKSILVFFCVALFCCVNLW